MVSFFIYRYTSSPDTGYVAEVSYEGTPIYPATLPKRPKRRNQQQGRLTSKRNKNSSSNDYKSLKDDVKLKFFSESN